VPTDVPTRPIAEKVADILRGAGYLPTIWEKGGFTRVYVERQMPNYRDALGYITISVNGAMSFRDISESYAEIRNLVIDKYAPP